MSDFEEGTVSSESQVDGSSGSDQQGQESQGESAQSSQQSESQQSPQLTKELLQEMFAGYSEQVNSQIGQMERRFADQLRKLAQQREEQTRKTVFPDKPEEFDLKSQEDLYRVLKYLKDTNDVRYRQLENKLVMAERAKQEERQADALYNYLEDQTSAAVRKFPALQDKEANDFLRRQIAAELYSNGGDIQKLNVVGVAAKISKLLGNRPDGRAKITNNNPIINKNSGSPSRPEKQSKEPRTMRELMDMISPDLEAIEREISEE